MSKEKSRQDKILEFARTFQAVQAFRAGSGEPANKQDMPPVAGSFDLGTFGGEDFGESKYDKDYQPGFDFFNSHDNQVKEEMVQSEFREQRAQEQPKGEKLLLGLGRMGVKAGTEFLKAPGYLIGGVSAAISGDIEDLTNNAWVEAFQGLDDTAKEAMPVYVREEVEKGTFWRQVWSPEFWANEGADGLGFMLSAIMSGGVTSAAIKGTQISAKMAKLAGGGAKLAGKIDTAIIAGTQSYLEAAAETKGFVDTQKQYWEGKFEEGLGYDSGKKDGNGETIYYDQEQIDSIIGTGGVQVLGMNALLLLGPNVIQSKYLFGKAKDQGAKSLFAKTARESTGNIDEMAKVLEKITPWKTHIKEGLKHGAISAASEAFQELSQFGIENYQEKKAKGLTNKNWVEGLFDGYVEGLTTVEGQKSMFLGAILGLGPGGFKAYKDSKAELAQAKGLTQLLSVNSAQHKDDLSKAYKKNADGSFVTDENGKVELDEAEYSKIMDSNAKDQILFKLYEEAKNNKDSEAARYALNEFTIRRAYNHMQHEGGMEVWEEHLKGLSEIAENDAINLGFTDSKAYINYLSEISKEAKKEYDNVKNQGPSFFGIKTGHLVSNNLTRKDLKETVQRFKNDVEYNAVRLSVLDKTLRKTRKQTEDVISNIKTAIRPEEGETFEQALAKDKMARRNYIGAKAKKSQLDKALDAIGTQYESIFNQKEQQLAFDNMIKANDKMQEAFKSDEQIKKERTEQVKSFFTNLKDKGYEIDETDVDTFTKKPIFLKDDNDVLYKVGKIKGKVQYTNSETGVTAPLTEGIIARDFTKPDNIVSPEDYIKWSKNKLITRRNATRLQKINELTIIGEQAIDGRQAKLTELNDKLKKFKDEISDLESLNISDKSITLDEVVIEIRRLQELVKDINQEIEIEKTKLAEALSLIDTLAELKIELLEVMQDEDNMNHFSFGEELRKLQEEINSGEFQTLEDLVYEEAEIHETLINELETVKDRLEGVLSKLYDSIIKHSQLKDILNTIKLDNISRKELQEILSKHPGVFSDTMEDLDIEAFARMLKNVETREIALNVIENNKQTLLESFDLESKKLQQVNIQIKKEYALALEALEEVSKIDKQILKFNNLNKLIKGLTFLYDKQIAAELSKEAKLLSLESTTPEQVDNNEDTNTTTAKKHTPYSTIIQVWERVKGKILYDNGRGGKIANWKQGARWAEAMSTIPIEDTKFYSLRVVNAEQLKTLPELGVTDIPSELSDDLYTVLYRKGEVYKVDGTPVYAGLAYAETYFPTGKDSNINLSRNSTWIAAKKQHEVSEATPFKTGKESFTSLKDLEAYLNGKIKAEYEKDRANILTKVKANEKVYIPIKDISKGFPSKVNTGSKSNPLKVFNKIKRLIIPESNVIRKSNNIGIDAIPGMVYVEDSQGQIHRVFNKAIGKDNKTINSILEFIHLSLYTDNGNMKTKFAFGNREKSIVGQGKNVGIMDHFINWGDKGANARWGITIQKSKAHNNQLVVRYVYNGKIYMTPVKDLVDDSVSPLDSGKPRTKKSDAVEIMPLVEFLRTKYYNVNSNKLGTDTKFGFKMPKGWDLDKNGIPFITYETDKKGYDNYVLTNHLYTDIVKSEEGGNNLPTFVNQYAEFELDKPTQTPIKTGLVTAPVAPVAPSKTSLVFGDNENISKEMLDAKLNQDKASAETNNFKNMMTAFDNKEAKTETKPKLKGEVSAFKSMLAAADKVETESKTTVEEVKKIEKIDETCPTNTDFFNNGLAGLDI